MGNKYYSLVASLPYLKLGEAPPISAERFFLECENWLAPEELSVLELLRSPLKEVPETGPAILGEWAEFDVSLHRDLAEARAARKKGQPFKTSEALRGIMSAETPLLMEKALEKMRWDFLEDKVLGYNFDTNWLVLYFLKLRILERLAKFDKDKGDETFFKLCEVRHEQAVR